MIWRTDFRGTKTFWGTINQLHWLLRCFLLGSLPRCGCLTYAFCWVISIKDLCWLVQIKMKDMQVRLTRNLSKDQRLKPSSTQQSISWKWSLPVFTMYVKVQADTDTHMRIERGCVGLCHLRCLSRLVRYQFSSLPYAGPNSAAFNIKSLDESPNINRLCRSFRRTRKCKQKN